LTAFFNITVTAFPTVLYISLFMNINYLKTPYISLIISVKFMDISKLFSFSLSKLGETISQLR